MTVRPGSSVLSAIELRRKTHHNREQGEAGGQSQGPQANCSLTRRTQAAADGETDNRRPGVLRSRRALATCLDRARRSISPRSIMKRVTLVVITAVAGAPVSEI